VHRSFCRHREGLWQCFCDRMMDPQT
jgi:hypothetical protein